MIEQQDTTGAVVYRAQATSAGYEVFCGSCPWHREFATATGAENGIAAHALTAHKIQIRIPGLARVQPRKGE